MQVVKCSKVGRTCVHGCAQNKRYFMCDYLLDVGHSRGCNPEECDKYVKRKGSGTKRRPVRIYKEGKEV